MSKREAVGPGVTANISSVGYVNLLDLSKSLNCSILKNTAGLNQMRISNISSTPIGLN